MKLSAITPYTEPIKFYNLSLTDADTMEKLIRHVETWKELAPDALEVVAKMKHGEFYRFRRGLLKERKGIFAGDEWARSFSIILMPKLLFEVSLLAEQYKVPWGLAYHRIHGDLRPPEKLKGPAREGAERVGTRAITRKGGPP